MKHRLMHRALPLFAVLVLFLLSGSAAWAAGKKPDARNVRWGMSKEEVIKAENGKEPAIVGESRLGYTDTILWNDALVDYSFDSQEKLFDVLLTIQTKTPENTTIIFIKLVEVLQKEYGPPSVIRNNGMEMAFATKRTAIFLENDKDSVVVQYTELSANHRSIEEDREPEKHYISLWSLPTGFWQKML